MLLEIANLTSSYGRIQALKGIDLHVNEGELVALVGANGAGKTTLLRACSGVQPITGGRIAFRGTTLNPLRPDRRVRLGISQVPEGRQIFTPLTVEDNLRLGAYTRRDRSAEDLEHVYELFPILKERRHQAAGGLSGGQQQMLAMGRAMMARPTLLLLDEPTMGLSPKLVQEIFETIRRLKAAGTTILLVEQNALAALSIADRGYVLETGSVAFSGGGRELADDPRVKTAYLGI